MEFRSRQTFSKAQEVCDQMEREKNGLVRSIAVWEIAIKIKNRKLDLGVDIDDYIATLKKSDVIRIILIDEEILLTESHQKYLVKNYYKKLNK